MSGPGIECDVASIGCALIATAVVVAGVPGEAAAKHIKHVAHHHNWSVRVRNAQAFASEPMQLGQMRYYGGPKSPMWRQ